MLNRELRKYLKPTYAASYNSRIGYRSSAFTNRSYVVSAILKGSWRNIVRRTRFAISEYLIANIFLLVILSKSLNPFSLVTKMRGIDYTTRVRSAFIWLSAAVMLILSLPLFLIVALAIKLDSNGSVFFRQHRVGMNRRKRDRRRESSAFYNCSRMVDRRARDQYGKPFTVYKFRTMVNNAEKRCGPIWATKNDPRVTIVGRFLRKTRLDELPQLINVLKGEMSIVGPRPERPFFVNKLASQIEGYTRRLEVKPGITGLAQVEGGYDGSVDDVKVKIGYDLSYISGSSIRRDLLIMVKTIGVIIGCRGL